MKNSNGYVYKVTVFGSRNTIDQQTIVDSKAICKYMAQNKLTLVNGAGQTGVMGFMSKQIKKFEGHTYGIGLYKVEDEKNKYLDEWEAYLHHYERQKRLIELGDVFLVMTGGLGTLYEAIDIHLMQFLGEINKPMIFVGEFASNYKKIIQFLEENNQLHKLPSNIHYAKDGQEANEIIDQYVKQQKSRNYINSTYYPALKPEEIFKHIKQNQNPYYISFNQIKMRVNPNVYPSNRFRSSKMLGEIVASYSKNKKVADIACGHGTMGIVAALNGAKHVVQVDINPHAVQNAKENIELHNLEDKIDLYEGDVFEPLSYRYNNYFDVIYFNPPFHRDTKHKDDKLMYAFYTQGNEGGVLEKFLKRAKYYLAPKGEIILGFSNKDPESLKFLEETLDKYDYNYAIKWQKNTETAADNRIYLITLKDEQINIKKKHKNPTIKLGLLTTMSGEASNDGQLITNGVKIALKELKQEGIKIELGIIEDQSKQTEAIKGSIKLIEKFKPDAIIGPTWSTLIESVAPLFEEAKIHYFTPATSTDLINHKTKYMLSGSNLISTKKDSISLWIKKNFYKKTAYIYKNIKWGQSHCHLFQLINDELKIEHNNIVYQEIHEFKNIIEQLKQNKPDTIFIDNYDTDFYLFLKLIKENKINATIVCNLSINENLKNEIQKLKLPNLIYIIDSNIPPEFIEKYKHEYKDKDCTRYAFNAYAGVHLITQAILNKKDKSIKDFLIEKMNPMIANENFSYNQNGDLINHHWIISKLKF